VEGGLEEGGRELFFLEREQIVSAVCGEKLM
jgi:hypothetical protein